MILKVKQYKLVCIHVEDKTKEQTQISHFHSYIISLPKHQDAFFFLKKKSLLITYPYLLPGVCIQKQNLKVHLNRNNRMSLSTVLLIPCLKWVLAHTLRSIYFEVPGSIRKQECPAQCRYCLSGSVSCQVLGEGEAGNQGFHF